MEKYIAIAAASLSLGLVAIGLSIAFAAACSGIARNPGAADKITNPLLIGAALVESLGLFSFITIILLLFL